MKIAILGFAGQGQSAYEYWSKDSNELTICDIDSTLKLPLGAKGQLGEDYLKNLGSYDVIVRTPGLHPREIAQANPEVPDILNRVTSVTNEFFKVCPTRNIIGVTGTKGKGTTSTLIAKMLESAGYRVHLGGNIGIPPLELLKNNIQADDWVVLELANFQLIDLKHSPHIGVCLMVEPEHLNWHDGIDEYLEAKRQMFRYQAENDIAVYYADNNYSLSIAGASSATLIPYMAPPGAEVKGKDIVIGKEKVCSVADIRLLGRHNWQNVCAAVTAVWQICQDRAALKSAISAFVGLPHRLEFVREIDGVRYYNDSFASAPGAAIAAMDAVKGTKVMIVGGFDRGLELEDMARAMVMHKDKLRRLVLIGASAHKLETELKAHGFTNYDIVLSKKMQDIVQRAKSIARQGDSIVFSPGFASFDMFKNFEDRGLQYKEVVNALA
ncbi:MAG TPA: UDP-N-acetylmuramoyl-L-alanine--D-glutamate ligase [Candidatus Limnocylindrales bacterium]|nr:UDP-N-acetylmuramoyl-L-alanine--D-glutamate ligase [Candidatus Limnocylindrales bacterium]